MEPFRIALIGCGWVSMACHGPAYRQYAQQHSDVILAAACDVALDRAQEFCQRYGFARAYADYHQMLAAERPSVVCLNVPEQLACQIGLDVLNAGIPLFMEKPPGVSPQEVDALAAASHRSGAACGVAFNRRFMPLMLAMQQASAGCAVEHIHYQMLRTHRAHYEFSPTALHAVDTVRFLAGCDYAACSLSYRQIPGAREFSVSTEITGRMANGVAVSLEINPIAGYDAEIATITAGERSFVLHTNLGQDRPGRLECFHQGRLENTLRGDAAAGVVGNNQADYLLDGFYQENAQFLDALRSGQAFPSDLADARQPVEIMQMMRERIAVRCWDGAGTGLQS